MQVELTAEQITRLLKAESQKLATVCISPGDGAHAKNQVDFIHEHLGRVVRLFDALHAAVNSNSD